MAPAKKKDVELIRKFLRDPASKDVASRIRKTITGSDILARIHPDLWEGRHSRFLGGSGDVAYEPYKNYFETILEKKCGSSACHADALSIQESATALFGAPTGGLDPAKLGLSVNSVQDTVYYRTLSPGQCFFSTDKTANVLAWKAVCGFFGCWSKELTSDLFASGLLAANDSGDLTGDLIVAECKRKVWSIAHRASSSSEIKELCKQGQPLFKLVNSNPQVHEMLSVIFENPAFKREVLNSNHFCELSQYSERKREFVESTAPLAVEDSKMPAMDSEKKMESGSAGSRPATPPKRVTMSPAGKRKCREVGPDENEGANATYSRARKLKCASPPSCKMSF